MSETVVYPAVPDGNTDTDQLTALARDAWEGKFGPGSLVVLGQEDFYYRPEMPYYRLVRIIGQGHNPSVGQLLDTGFVKIDRGIVTNMPCSSQGDSGFLSFGHRDISHSFRIHPEKSRWTPDFLEVSPGEPDPVAMLELVTKSKTWANPLHPANQIQLFGTYATFIPGETYRVGASGDEDHREFNAEIIYLPTGRWGWIGNLILPENRTWLAGVTDAPDWDFDLSPYCPIIVSPNEFGQPSDEEAAFLSTRYELDGYQG